MEALYHAHFHRWDYRRITQAWWTQLINDVATSHNIDVLMDRHPLPLPVPLPVPTHPYMLTPPTNAHGEKHTKVDGTSLLSSHTRPASRVDEKEVVTVPFSRPLIPFSCTTRGGGGEMDTTPIDTASSDGHRGNNGVCGVGTHHTPRRSCAIDPTTGHNP